MRKTKIVVAFFKKTAIFNYADTFLTGTLKVSLQQ